MMSLILTPLSIFGLSTVLMVIRCLISINKTAKFLLSTTLGIKHQFYNKGIAVVFLTSFITKKLLIVETHLILANFC